MYYYQIYPTVRLSELFVLKDIFLPFDSQFIATLQSSFETLKFYTESPQPKSK